MVKTHKKARKIGARVLIGLLAAVAAPVFAEVDWPSDFNDKLAAHIAAEKSTNTCSVAYELEVDSCVRTFAYTDFAVARKPYTGFIINMR